VIRSACAVHFVALSVWVGGLAAIALVVAPVAFHVNRDLAGQVVGASLRVFGRVELVMAAIALMTAFVCQSVGVWGGTVRWVRLAMLLLMTALSLAYVAGVYPAIEKVRGRAEAKADFDRLHRRSVQLVGANLLLGVVTIGLSAAAMKSPDGA